MLYSGHLDTGAIISMAAAKLKPFIFSVPSYALPNIMNLIIIVGLDNFCLFSA
jgi:hypothetical protein